MVARLATVAAVIIFAAGCTSAASHAPAATSSDRASSARFEGAGLTFSYPAVWQAATWNDDVSDSSWVIVALSTTAQQDPCDSSVNIGATRVTKTCGEPVSALPPGRMLVMWTEQGFSHWRQPATTRTVGGRPASETHGMLTWCKSLGGTETIEVVIPRSLADNWYQMDACLRGPGLPGSEAQIAAMLASVRISKGW